MKRLLSQSTLMGIQKLWRVLFLFLEGKKLNIFVNSCQTYRYYWQWTLVVYCRKRVIKNNRSVRHNDALQKRRKKRKIRQNLLLTLRHQKCTWVGVTSVQLLLRKATLITL